MIYKFLVPGAGFEPARPELVRIMSDDLLCRCAADLQIPN